MLARGPRPCTNSVPQGVTVVLRTKRNWKPDNRSIICVVPVRAPCKPHSSLGVLLVWLVMMLEGRASLVAVKKGIARC
jgi:hypothetical protein